MLQFLINNIFFKCDEDNLFRYLEHTILRSENICSQIYVEEKSDKHFNELFLSSGYFVPSNSFQNSIVISCGASISLRNITNSI